MYRLAIKRTEKKSNRSHMCNYRYLFCSSQLICKHCKASIHTAHLRINIHDNCTVSYGNHIQDAVLLHKFIAKINLCVEIGISMELWCDISVETIYMARRTNSIIYSNKFGMTFPVVYNSSHGVKILSYPVLQSNDVCLLMFTRLIKVS